MLLKILFLASTPQFREVGDTALPGVLTTCGTPQQDYIIEVNGGGLALGDFDGDGDADLVVVDGSTLERAQKGEPGLPPRLFLNTSEPGRIRFEPAGAAWAMSGGRWGMGCASGDFDGDGWLDLVVTQWGPTRLFLNQAGRGFQEVEKPGFVGDGWGSSAAALDYDGDGWLDLAVIRYLAFDTREIASRTSGKCRWKELPVMCGPQGLTPVHDQLYRNLGAGRYQDASMSAGFRPPSAAFGLGCMPLDYDQDGDADLYVANDSQPNHLWENQGGGKFAEVGNARGAATTSAGKELASMGIGCNDLDGDGLAELFVTVFSGEENALFWPKERRNKDGVKLAPMFKERSGPLGLGGPSRPLLGWGTALEDYDHDGDIDVHVFNGHVYPQADEPGTDSSYAQRDQLYRNVSTDRTKPKFAPEPLSDAGPLVTRASAPADLDGDGDLDLVALVRGGPVRVLENLGGAAGTHWLRVRVAGEAPNTQSIGARVTARCGDVVRSREIRTAGGYQSAVPAEAHFGLGAAELVDVLEVRWPDGHVQRQERVPADGVITVERKTGAAK